MIKPLTSLRFFAAMMVVFHHFWGFKAGYGGVSFFYVLSGFVLTISLREPLTEREAKIEFWWRRIARIYPTHLLTLIVAATLGSSLKPIAFNLTLTQSWVPLSGVYFSFDAPSWSISDEAFFYLLFPWLIGWLTSNPVPKLLAWTGLLVGVAAACALIWPQSTLETPAVHFLFYIFPPARLLEFALGIGMALIGRPARFGIRIELLALAVAALSILLSYAPIPGPLLGSLVFLPGGLAVIFVFSRSEGIIARLLSHRAVVALGDASFMLYMIHSLVFRVVHRPEAALIISLTMSIALHFAFEKPMQRRILNWRSHRLDERKLHLPDPSPAPIESAATPTPVADGSLGSMPRQGPPTASFGNEARR